MLYCVPQHNTSGAKCVCHLILLFAVCSEYILDISRCALFVLQDVLVCKMFVICIVSNMCLDLSRILLMRQLGFGIWQPSRYLFILSFIVS